MAFGLDKYKGMIEKAGGGAWDYGNASGGADYVKDYIHPTKGKLSIPKSFENISDFMGAFSGQAGADAAREAAQLQYDATVRGQDIAMGMYEQGRRDQKPFLDSQTENTLIRDDEMASGMYDPGQFNYNGMGDYQPEQFQDIDPWQDPGAYQAEQWNDPGAFDASKFQEDPGYQFRMQQGLQNLENSAMARGGYGGTRDMQNMMDYSQGLASQEYNNAYNRYEGERADSYNRYTGDRAFGAGQWDANRDFGRQNYDVDRMYGRANYLDDRGFGSSQWDKNRMFDYGNAADAYNSKVNRAGNLFNQRTTMASGGAANQTATNAANAGNAMSKSMLAGAGALGQGITNAANANAQGAENIGGALGSIIGMFKK